MVKQAALCLLAVSAFAEIAHAQAASPDVDTLRALGIRQLQSNHLTLYTDVPSSSAVDELPAIFDLAIPQWVDYFQLDKQAAAEWRMTGCLMRDRERFQRAGLLPESMPDFLNGYSMGSKLWFFDQDSDYYRRHLMLHEGTHAVMEAAFGRGGPPWHFEGMAELLATHQYQDGRLTLKHFPQNREEVPLWGRIRVIQDAVKQGQPMSLDAVMAFDNRAHLQVEPYAWCWAATAFLDGHPRYRDRFREMSRQSGQRQFNNRFRQAFGDDWPHVREEWQVFVADLEYGYEISRTTIDFTAGRRPSGTNERVSVSAERGWQNTGLLLEAGKAYRLTAEGRYQVANQPSIWWCEPGGVSIRYYHGRPLGMLLAAVHPSDPSATGISPFIDPIAVGLGGEITSPSGGTLFLRVNDSAAELSDNVGQMSVVIETP